MDSSAAANIETIIDLYEKNYDRLHNELQESKKETVNQLYGQLEDLINDLKGKFGSFGLPDNRDYSSKNSWYTMMENGKVKFYSVGSWSIPSYDEEMSVRKYLEINAGNVDNAIKVYHSLRRLAVDGDTRGIRDLPTIANTSLRNFVAQNKQ